MEYPTAQANQMDPHLASSYTIPLGCRNLTRSPDHYTTTLPSEYRAEFVKHHPPTKVHQHQKLCLDALQALDGMGFSGSQIRKLIHPRSPAQRALGVLRDLPNESLAFLNAGHRPETFDRCWPRTTPAILSSFTPRMSSLGSFGSRSSVSTLSSGCDASLQGSMTSSLNHSPLDKHVSPTWPFMTEAHVHGRSRLSDYLCEPYQSPTIDANGFNDANFNNESLSTPPPQPQYNPFNAASIASPIESSSGYETSTFASQIMNYASPLIPNSPLSPARLMELHIPCPEEDCKRTYKRVEELKKHLEGVHDQDTTYFCTHPGCNPEVTVCYRSDHAKRHHTEAHKDHDCIGEGSCIRSICQQRKRYWGCHLCVTVLEDLTSYVNHWRDHMIELGGNKEKANYSMMIFSLLQQEATKIHWQTRLQTEHCQLIWSPPACVEIRRALEFGIYKGYDISQLGVPGLVDDLLEVIVAEGRSWMSG
ncbi:hypothetical protein RBB50_001629 [Rhinocladiella similis]